MEVSPFVGGADRSVARGDEGLMGVRQFVRAGGLEGADGFVDPW